MKRSFSLIKKIFCIAIFLLCASVGHEVHAVAGEIDTTFFPSQIGGANDVINAMVVQSDGKMIIGGSFTTYNGALRNYITRLNTDGSLDTTFNIGTGANYAISTVAIQNDGKIVIGGSFTTYNGTARNRIARINIDGSLDTTFNPGTGANNAVQTTIVQPDGKILIGGSFTTYNGTARNRIARINIDGSLDTTFDPGTGVNSIYVLTMGIQPDGKILIGGEFTTYNGIARNRIARINIDGSLDTTFDPGTGANRVITKFVVQSDGKIMVGGNFDTYNGITRRNIMRVNTDGSLDATFAPSYGASSTVNEIVLQTDGKMMIGGSFTSYNLVTRRSIARINSDGSLDATFAPLYGVNGGVYVMYPQTDGKIIIAGYFTAYDNISRSYIARINADSSLDTAFSYANTGLNSYIRTILIQPDNKVLVGGSFTLHGNTSRNYFVRLNADGSLDTAFDPGTGTAGSAGASNNVHTIALQSDGKIIIGGYFYFYNGISRNCLARVNADGSLDTTFNIGSGPSGYIQSILVQPDGKILIGGNFTTYNGTARNRIARLNTDGSLDTTFDTSVGADATVTATALQPDGKIIVVGDFTTFNGISNNHIVRLNNNGSIDTTFISGTGLTQGVGSVYVNSVIVQSDGKILFGGQFQYYNGIARTGIVRINSNGSIDTAFDPGTGGGVISAVAMQSDGKIIIGGSFIWFNGVARNRIARLNANGSLDTTFNPGTGANNSVYAIGIQSDGNIVIGGPFTLYNNSFIAAYLTRLVATNYITPPTVTTYLSSFVTSTTATGNGAVTATGGEDPARYIQWGTSPGVYTSSCAAGSGGTGVYNCALTNLAANTTYYARAYATNSAGTGYGFEMSFVTSASLLPTVTTQSATQISSTTATINANLTNDGGGICTRQIEYGTTSGVYTQTCDAGLSNAGTYVCNITNLTQDTIYFYRAKVTNSEGVVYGDEMQFTTDAAVDVRASGSVKFKGTAKVK